MLKKSSAFQEMMEKEGLVFAGRTTVKNQSAHFEVPPNKKGYYVVGLYMVPPQLNNPEILFHFMRQDSDGGWSDKMDSNPVDRAFSPTSDGGYQSLPATFGRRNNYDFMGYWYVPKEGIDAGLEQKLIPAILATKARDGDVYEIFKGLVEAESLGRDDGGMQAVAEVINTMRKYNIPDATQEFESCFVKQYGKKPSSAIKENISP